LPGRAGRGTLRVMRILMLAPEPVFSARGTPISVRERAEALARLGHAVDLATYPFGEDFDAPGVSIRRAARPLFIKDVRAGPSLGKLALDARLKRLARSLAKRNRYDAVHSHEEMGAFGARLARGIGAAHVYDMHSSLPEQLGNYRAFQWGRGFLTRLERAAIRKSDATLAISASLAAHARRVAPGARVEVVENAFDVFPRDLDESGAAVLRKTLGLAPDARVVAYTGSLGAQQGIGLLLEATARVLAGEPRAAFVIAGGGPGLARWKKEAAKLGPRVVLAGPRPLEEMPAFVALAEVLVSPRTRGRNYPIKLCHWLRAGRPVAATDVPVHADVLTDDVARLAQPTPEGLARAILDLLGDAALADRLGAAARALGEARFTRARLERDLGRAYAPLAAREPRG